MKAIHNRKYSVHLQDTLLSVGQRYKVWKQFTTGEVKAFLDKQLLSVGQRYKVWKQFTTQFVGTSDGIILLSVGQRYKVWKQFTTVGSKPRALANCYQ